MREKYSTKTPFKKFMHKYTGIIVLIIVLSVVILFWTYNETNKVFFENWMCDQIIDITTDNLNDIELTRYHIITSECILLPFTGDP